MKIQLLFLAVAVLIQIPAHGQYFETHFGAPESVEAADFIQTSSGRYIFTGSIKIGALPRVIIGELDGAGDTLWTKTYRQELTQPGDRGYRGHRIFETADGGFVVFGDSLFTNTPASFTFRMVMKTDASGNLLWSKTYPEGIFINMLQTVAGEFIVIAELGGNMKLQKFDADFDLLWEKNISYGTGNGHFHGVNLAEAANQEFVLVGHGGFASKFQLLARLSEQGDTLWTRLSTQTTDYFKGRAIQVESNGDYTMLSDTSSDAGNIHLSRTDSDGNILWSRIYGGSGLERAVSLKRASDGWVILGEIKTGLGDWDILLLKTDDTGNLLWSHTFGDTLDDHANRLEILPDGDLLVAGTRGVPTGSPIGGAQNHEFYLLKLSETGEIVSGVLSDESDAQWRIYPNPTVSGFTILLEPELAGSVESAHIFDRLGSEIYAARVNSAQNLTVNTSQFSPGIYLVQLRGKNGISSVKQMVVVK